MPEPRPQQNKIAPRTLMIAGVASAVATYVVSRIWGPGTIFGAAATPVIVALVSEGLRKPTETVAETVKRAPIVPPVVRGRARANAPEEARRQGVDLDQPTDVVRPPTDPTLVIPGGDATIHTTGRQPFQRHWKLAIITGLVAFVIVAVGYTVRDVVAGDGIGSSGRSSTLFSGTGHKKAKKKHTSTSTSSTSTTPTSSTKTPTTTVQQTVTETTPATTAPQQTTTDQTTSPTGTTGATGATGAGGASGSG